jgi:hypothetical protein
MHGIVITLQSLCEFNVLNIQCIKIIHTVEHNCTLN